MFVGPELGSGKCPLLEGHPYFRGFPVLCRTEAPTEGPLSRRTPLSCIGRQEIWQPSTEVGRFTQKKAQYHWVQAGGHQSSLPACQVYGDSWLPRR